MPQDNFPKCKEPESEYCGPDELEASKIRAWVLKWQREKL